MTISDIFSENRQATLQHSYVADAFPMWSKHMAAMSTGRAHMSRRQHAGAGTALTRQYVFLRGIDTAGSEPSKMASATNGSAQTLLAMHSWSTQIKRATATGLA